MKNLVPHRDLHSSFRLLRPKSTPSSFTSTVAMMRQATITKLLKHAVVYPHRAISRHSFASSAATSSGSALPPKGHQLRRAAKQEPLDATNEPTIIADFRESSAPHPLRPVKADKMSTHDIATIEQTHIGIVSVRDRVATAIKAVRNSFDVLSGNRGPGGGMTEKDWLNRCLFVESVAGVPGMVTGVLRRLRSLRSLKRDHGWIHLLLEETEKERMPLQILMNLKQPGWVFRALVFGAQGVFFNGFFLAYLASPQTFHRIAGYLEEEAAKTYAGLLKDIDDGHLDAWKTKEAPLIARTYYKLPEDASVCDFVKRVRAEEANPPRREPHV